MLFCFVQTKSFQSCDKCSSVAWARGRCSWKLGTFERSCKMKTQAMAAILQIIFQHQCRFCSVSTDLLGRQRLHEHGICPPPGACLAWIVAWIRRMFAFLSLFSDFFRRFQHVSTGARHGAPVGQEPLELQCRLHQFEGLRLSPDHCRRGDLLSADF